MVTAILMKPRRRTMPEGLHLAFWNVENLFDAENALRSEKLARIVGKDLRG
jgi:hypothetical protein